MKFDIVDTSGSGSSHTPINFENMSWYDSTPFEFRTILTPAFKEPGIYDNDKRKKLDLNWHHWIFFKGSELFMFHSYSHSYVTDEETLPTIDQLKLLIIKSFSHLQKSFDERRKEFNVLPVIGDLSQDTVEHTVFQLLAIFLPEQK